MCPVSACKRKEEPQIHPEHTPAPKKPRLVFTDLQRRTLQAIFKVVFNSINVIKTRYQRFFLIKKQHHWKKQFSEHGEWTDPQTGLEFGISLSTLHQQNIAQIHIPVSSYDIYDKKF